MLVALNTIRLDGGTQPRATINSPLFEEYAQAMAEGATFPPVILFYDGAQYWLADGYHRYYAHQTLGLVEIEADVRQGDRRAAVLYSVSANAEHGWRRTNDDKRRAVLALLADAEWVQWSDREISRRCRVSHEFVRKLRPIDTVNNDSMRRTFVHPKTGQPTQMEAARIGATAKNLPVIAGREPDRRPDLTFAVGECLRINSASRATGFAAEPRSGEPTINPVYDHEANGPYHAAIDLIESLVVGVSPEELLRWWATYLGAGFEGSAVTNARAWIIHFADGYPAAERQRRAFLARIPQENAA